MSREPLLPPHLLEVLREGVAHHQSGRLEQAEACYETVLAAAPDCPQALHLRGLLAHATGRHELALELLTRADVLAPDDPDTLTSLGALYQYKGSLEMASSSYRRLSELNPSSVKAWASLARTLEQLNNFEAAAESYQRAVALEPGNADFHRRLGASLQQCGKSEQALRSLEEALKLDPGNPEIYDLLGVVLVDLGQAEAAVKVLSHAISLNPNSAQAFCNLGYFFYKNMDLSSAAESYRRALQMDPNSVVASFQLATVLYQLGEFVSSRQYFRRTRNLQTDSRAADYFLALIDLLHGEFAQGWQGYEHRRNIIEKSKDRDFCQPQWKGEPLEGAPILLHSEQGNGDTMQFARYIPMVAARGGKVLLQVQPGLRRLLLNCGWAVQVLSTEEPVPDYAWHCPLPSLPLAFDTRMDTIPSHVPYLHPDPADVEVWHQRLAGNTLRIGLCWTGSTGNASNRWRSIPLSLLSSLLKIPGTSFYSLQKGAGAEQVQEFPQIVDLASEQKDFADTAAIIANLDLVITVDTAVAHLAGAMGKPVWVLLHNAPDWRWLLNRDDSPWYPTARLFRQKVHAQWQEVVSSVEQELRKLQQSAMAAGMAE